MCREHYVCYDASWPAALLSTPQLQCFSHTNINISSSNSFLFRRVKQNRRDQIREKVEEILDRDEDIDPFGTILGEAYKNILRRQPSNN